MLGYRSKITAEISENHHKFSCAEADYPSHSLLTEFRAALSFWPWVCWHGAAVLEQTQIGRVRAVASPKAEPRGVLHPWILRCHYSWVKGDVRQATPR